MEKYCNRCDTTKPVSEFNKHANRKDGLTDHCRQCRRQTAKEWYEKNPDYRKEWRKKNPDYNKEWREKNPDKYKEQTERNRLRQYGMTIEDYDNLLAQQNNRCAICRQENEDGKSLHVDHDHSCCKGKESCGKCVRGLLCLHCNMMLGYARDNIETLEKAQNYVKRHSKAEILEIILD